MKTIQLTLTDEELSLLADALDSHAYWQLADGSDRNSGYVTGDSLLEPETAECLALEARLRHLAGLDHEPVCCVLCGDSPLGGDTAPLPASATDRLADALQGLKLGSES